MQTIRIDLGSTYKMRGKCRVYDKPCASALGVTAASHTSPIKNLVKDLIERQMIQPTDLVEVYAHNGTISFYAQPASNWVDSRALGRKPGTRPWLRKQQDDEEGEDE